MESIGYRIAKARRYLGMNQKELCDKVNINEATLSRYENNLREPKASILIELSQVLEVSTDYLLGVTNIRNHNILQDSYPKDIETIYNIISEMLSKDGLTLYGRDTSRDDFEFMIRMIKSSILMVHNDKIKSI